MSRYAGDCSRFDYKWSRSAGRKPLTKRVKREYEWLHKHLFSMAEGGKKVERDLKSLVFEMWSQAFCFMGKRSPFNGLRNLFTGFHSEAKGEYHAFLIYDGPLS